MADTELVLGSITFAGFELPEEIPFGGDQALSIKKLVGGARVIDALGSDDADIAWAGRFQSADAMDRALAVDQMRRAGQAISLNVFGLSYSVVIAKFEYRVQRAYQILYSISLAVVQDNTTPSTQSSATLDDLVGSDMADVNTVVPGLNTLSVAPAIGALNSAVASVGTLEGAALSALAPVRAAADNAISVLNEAISTVDGAIQTDAGSIAGIVAGGFAPTMVSTFNDQLDQITEQASLLHVSAVINRVATNIAQATG